MVSRESWLLRILSADALRLRRYRLRCCASDRLKQRSRAAAEQDRYLFESVIVHIGTRFGPTLVPPKKGAMDEGTIVEMKNGVYGVSYEYVEAVGNSRIGDRVMTCLTSLPNDCPKGDDRGKMYTTTNLRTQES